MGSVMIRVDQATREAIAELAEQDHRTLGDEVAYLARREARARAVRAGYERLMADPEQWREYVAERDEWLDGDLSDLADGAADEYPEYNQ